MIKYGTSFLLILAQVILSQCQLGFFHPNIRINDDFERPHSLFDSPFDKSNEIGNELKKFAEMMKNDLKHLRDFPFGNFPFDNKMKDENVNLNIIKHPKILPKINYDNNNNNNEKISSEVGGFEYSGKPADIPMEFNAPDRIITIIKLNTDDDGSNIGKDDVLPEFYNFAPIELPINTSNESLTSNGIMEDFVNSLKGLMETLKEPFLNENVFNDSIIHAGEPCRLDIKIEDHGRIYKIPKDARVNRQNPGFVNVTWHSDLKDVNNSLCFNVVKEDGHIKLGYITLNIVKDGLFHRYNSADPVHLTGRDDSNTIIQLSEGVQIDFPTPESFELLFDNSKPEKSSIQWLVFSMALLVLVIGGLIMLLSYIMYSKNLKLYERKSSISKEPIA